MKRPIIVLGVGRCGTSSTCRVLDNEFEICFGHFRKLRTKDYKSLEPMYEDPKLKSAIKRSWEDFLTAYNEIHLSTCNPGIKILRLAKVSVDNIKTLNPIGIIECWKEEAANIQSLIKYGFDKVEAKNWYWGQKKGILELKLSLQDQFPWIPIEFSSEYRKTDEEIYDLVKELFLNRQPIERIK